MLYYEQKYLKNADWNNSMKFYKVCKYFISANESCDIKRLQNV